MATLELHDIYLSYPVYGGAGGSVMSAAKSTATGGIIKHRRNKAVEVTALDGVTLTARDGDRIGILGHNGAGKTTLLKVAAGILRPGRGRIRRLGKTVAVINPSVGLDQRLSGYENLEQIALLYGLSRREIALIRPEIATFTQLGEFLDLPVSTYSSGMRTRLAFGVATAFHPEILIADENIGAGDAQFITRAKERMQNMMERASILILATHSLKTMNTLCNRAILMGQGRILADGNVDDVIAAYEDVQRSAQP